MHAIDFLKEDTRIVALCNEGWKYDRRLEMKE